MLYNSILDLVGNTPLLQLNNYSKFHKLYANVFSKLECYNPAGSVKDRIAKAMIENAEKEGMLKSNSVIIEPTSGNTGIGLASIGVAKGYKVILTMPNTMSNERIQLLKAYGAELVLTDGKLGMKGAIDKANELALEYKNSFIPNQFNNMVNPLTHFNTTGEEIWKDLNGKVDIFIAGIGTGGTLSGTGEYLKSKNPNIKIVGVEPFDSPLISKGISASHKIQGIGANFIPNTLNKAIYNEIACAKYENAVNAIKDLSKTEGVLIGISGGAALSIALEYAKLKENTGKNIVIILPDSGERYLSLNLY